MDRSSERREFLRAELNVFIHEESRTARMLARAVDVSERGLAYVMPNLPHGRDSDEVNLEFSLPGDDLPVRALGRIVQDRPAEHTHGTAIEFTMIASADAERIRRYVGQRKRAELFESLRREHLLQ